MLKRLPIGCDIFDDVIKKDYYYVDKTTFIEKLVSEGSYVSLFTRPRRFGKSLNMSMLKNFFKIGADKSLFDGLKISENKEFCEKYQGQFPVIAISLKEASCNNFKDTKNRLYTAIGDEADRLKFLLESEKIDYEDKDKFKKLIKVNCEAHSELGFYDMNESVFADSLQKLSYLLYKHYGKKVIVLIDEYDVPIASGFRYGYYDDIISLMRNFFSYALKTNEYLEFAVLTGCMRIAKESIFTGLNNFKVFTVSDNHFSEYFGFTDAEVKEMFKYYGVENKYDEAKTWYDGFRVGKRSLFASWDVLNYVSELRVNPEAKPANYWAQTSSNQIIKKLLEKADTSVKSELEILISGGVVTKQIKPDIVYNELYSTVNNIWSVMLSTGYLTIIDNKEIDGDEYFDLAIPNYELRKVYKEQIKEWFEQSLANSKSELTKLQQAFLTGDAQTAENMLNSFLKETISIRDSIGDLNAKESFYHGVLLGLLSNEGQNEYIIKSNREAGDGYYDICLLTTDEETGVILELKVAQSENLDKTCDKALKQIDDKRYVEIFDSEFIKHIYKYGIAFKRKRCKVKLATND